MSKEIAIEMIAARIMELRGKKIMLDRDLAKLYGVQVKVLNQAVKRNIKRFPEDFMLKLSRKEAESLRSQFVTLNNTKTEVSKRGKHFKYLPYAFTEQGVAMLSSVLRSRRAVLVNIQIMRAFVNLKRLALTYAELKRKIDSIEKKYDKQFAIVFQTIKQLLEPPIKPKPPIGFRTYDDNKKG